MKLKALKDFYLKAGQRISEGDVFEASEEVATQLVLRKSAEYAKGTYETKVVVETPLEPVETEVVKETPAIVVKRKTK